MSDRLSTGTRQKHVFLSGSPSVTFNLGKRLGERLNSGSIFALIGELGCGKTLLTRGICAGLGVPDRRVNSPTFVLVNEYQGRLPVFHMDLYRLSSIQEGFEIGLLDYMARAEAGVIVVEWAEKILSLLPDTSLQIQFEVVSPMKRRVLLSGAGEKFSDLLRGLDK